MAIFKEDGFISKSMGALGTIADTVHVSAQSSGKLIQSGFNAATHVGSGLEAFAETGSLYANLIREEKRVEVEVAMAELAPKRTIAKMMEALAGLIDQKLKCKDPLARLELQKEILEMRLDICSAELDMTEVKADKDKLHVRATELLEELKALALATKEFKASMAELA